MNNADNSDEYVFSEQHRSPESQQNPNTRVDLLNSVNVIDHDTDSIEDNETLQ